jgi:adenylate cyclase
MRSPFANMSGEPEQEYFSDGISEDVITDLSKVSALAVTGPQHGVRLQGQRVDCARSCAATEVSHVLEGVSASRAIACASPRSSSTEATGNHVWAERYDRDLSEIFALQDEISKAIVSALKVKLLPEEKSAIEARGTLNLQGLYAVPHGAAVLGHRQRSLPPLIVRLCERATEIDPNYAPAWALLAIGQANMRALTSKSAENGWDAANRALALDPNLAEAHAAKGRVLADQTRYDEAVR